MQVAHTPNLDHIAQLGMNGLYHSYLQGTAMPSELAHFLMFGYDMHEIPGRGLIEAIGYNIPISDGDVAVLARLFSVARENDMLVVQEEKPDIDGESCYTLQESLGTLRGEVSQIDLIPRYNVEGILMLRGDFSAKITDSNPIYVGRPIMEVTPTQGAESDERALRASYLMNTYLKMAHEVLSSHPINRERVERGLLPVNAIATQRAGQRTQIASFADRWGLKSASMSSGPMYEGMCSLLEMENIKVPKTGDPEQDLLQQLRMAREISDFDFIHLHTKAPDEAAHTKNSHYKKEVIEALDRALSYAVDSIIPDENILFVVTADHSTASAGEMIHSGETVPITMTGKYTRRDNVDSYNEISCASGALGVIRGKELMYLILNFLDRGKLWGLMDSPVDQPYFPGNYKILKI